MDNIQEVLEENRLRNDALRNRYDPLLGIGCCGERKEVRDGTEKILVPVSLLQDPDYISAKTKIEKDKARFKHDFEFWAAKCVKIKDKSSGRDVPFVLNRPQRRLLAALEEDRTAGLPCRIIMLKARQWGGSTLVQIYMAWNQIILTTGSNSLICAHVKDTAATIRGMYSKVLDLYPKEFQDEDCPLKFKPFERSVNTRIITGRNCKVSLGSSERQDAIRGADYALAHLSEVAFWKNTPGSSPESFIQSICGAINQTAGTMIVLESTANGVGNYFHREWLRSVRGESDKRAFFVPWYEIEIYRSRVKNPQKLWEERDDYERKLWENKAVTLEMIQWYHNKRKEYPSHSRMQAEYPSNDVEAFTNTGNNVFSADKIVELRKNCMPPQFVGEIIGNRHTGPRALQGLHFTADDKGMLKIWEMPQKKENDLQNRYIVSVDIGGRSDKSDYSVISVLDRENMANGGRIKVVAQWRGHADHDIVAWKSAAISMFYNKAMLVLESNTLDTDNIGGDPAFSILTELNHHYPNLYKRHSPEGSIRLGFHTNYSTKTMIINRLIALVRDNGYIERDEDACNEMAVYEQQGLCFGAMEGNHDDIVMARAIGLFVATELPATPCQNLSSVKKKQLASQYSVLKPTEIL